MVLHKSSCKTIQHYPEMHKNPGGFTERNYIKVCAIEIRDLSNWTRLNGRKNGDF